MNNITYSITNTTGTIPVFNAIAGTVTADSGSLDTLIYIDTIDLKDIINDGNVGACVYLFIPSITNDADKIVKVLGASLISFVENTGVFTYAFKVDRDISAVNTASFSYLNVPLLGFSYLNTGSTSGEVDGVSIASTVGLSQSVNQIDDQNYGTNFRPLYVDATGTDFLINSTTHE